MKNSVNLNSVKAIPILDVAQALGMELSNRGSGNWAMKDDEGVSSLVLSEKRNDWKRFSGKESGGVSGGSVINLVMHVTADSDFKNALEWFRVHFPEFI